MVMALRFPRFPGSPTLVADPALGKPMLPRKKPRPPSKEGGVATIRLGLDTWKYEWKMARKTRISGMFGAVDDPLGEPVRSEA
jgi:hypothetical protein